MSAFVDTPDATTVLAGTLLVGLLGWAVLSDIRRRRIPNILTGTGLLAAFAVHATGLWLTGRALAGADWYAPLAGAVVGAAAVLPLHLVRALGAGDVKLMAMVGAYIGAPAVLWAVPFTFIAGGALVAVYLAVDAHARERVMAALLANMATASVRRPAGARGARGRGLLVSGVRMPYALAIAAGSLLAAWLHTPAGRWLG